MIIKEKNVAYQIDGSVYHCAMGVTMSFIAGKWKTVVLWYLKNETLRFAELKRKIPDITEKMLSLQLRALEEDGLITREVSGTKPPLKVEYSLTEFGRTLIPVINALAKWGRELGETKGQLITLKTK